MIYPIICAYIFVLATFISSTTLVNSEEDTDDEIPRRPDDLDVTIYDHNYYGVGYYDYNIDRDPNLSSKQENEDFFEYEPDEAKERLEILFESMDVDKNGNLSRSELSQWIVQSFIKLDAQRSLPHFEVIDANKDTRISLDEFWLKTYNHTEKEVEELTKLQGTKWTVFVAGITVDREKFHMADRNNDSLLDLDEFIRFNNPVNYKEMALFVRNRILHLLDKNKDGFIDLPEVLGDVFIDNGTDSLQINNFKKCDKDNNGVLDKEEISGWAPPEFEKTAQAEVKQLFLKTDINKDNELSKEEVINQHDLWVGSHATDYGKHLDDVEVHDEL